MSRMAKIRKAMRVKRHHADVILEPETVGHHSCNVALLILEIYNRANVHCPATLLEYALLHDVAEVYTGDVPYPAKRNKALKEELDKMEEAFYTEYEIELPMLTNEELALFKFCDMWDFGLKMEEEIRMGNLEGTEERMETSLDVMESLLKNGALGEMGQAAKEAVGL